MTFLSDWFRANSLFIKLSWLSKAGVSAGLCLALFACAPTSQALSLQQERAFFDSAKEAYFLEAAKETPNQVKLNSLSESLNTVRERIDTIIPLSQEAAEKGWDYYWKLTKDILTFIGIGVGVAIGVSG